MNTKTKVALFLNEPTQSNFEKIKNCGLSLLLIYQKLEDKEILLRFLSFKEWERIYECSLAEMQTFVLQKMNEFVFTFDEWRKIHNNSRINEVKKIALKKCLS